MLHSLIVGFGRSGRGLHLPTLLRLRARTGSAACFAGAPIVAVDPAHDPGAAPVAGRVVVVPGVESLPDWLDPGRTVAHLCTPPGARLDVLRHLARTGVRRFLIDKPLATGEDELAAISAVRRRWDLDIAVVAQWDAGELTRRLAAAIAGGRYGPLRAITVAQHKPRFGRTLRGDAHPTAFDVEIPHALAVVLRLAGPARLRDAGLTDLRIGTDLVPRMGGAWLALDHDGVRSEITSDLMSPTRERRITLDFAHATVVGHYPASDADDTAQLRVVTAGGTDLTAFHDDSLGAFVQREYSRFTSGAPGTDCYEPHAEVVRLLCAAKQACARLDEAQAVRT